MDSDFFGDDNGEQQMQQNDNQGNEGDPFDFAANQNANIAQEEDDFDFGCKLSAYCRKQWGPSWTIISQFFRWL